MPVHFHVSGAERPLAASNDGNSFLWNASVDCCHCRSGKQPAIFSKVVAEDGTLLAPPRTRIFAPLPCLFSLGPNSFLVLSLFDKLTALHVNYNSTVCRD